MKNIKFIFLFMLLVSPLWGQKSDSLRLLELESKMNSLNEFRRDTKQDLESDFRDLSTKLNEDISKDSRLIRLTGIGLGVFGLTSLAGLFGIWWKGKKYIEEKINTKFDKIITEKEGDILALIDQQSQEKQFVKNKKILVLTAKDGDDTFLRKFFKAMDFPIDNVNYEKVSKYEELKKDYDLIFANNEKAKLEKEIINEYFEKSPKETVLFYFNSTREQYNNSKVENRLSFANAKTQIYGNLINLFKFQKTL